MDHKKLSLPDLKPGEDWTVRIHNQHVGDLAVIVHIQTPGGTVISLPMQLNGDLRIVAGTDTGTTIVTLDLRADEVGVARTLN